MNNCLPLINAMADEDKKAMNKIEKEINKRNNKE